MVHIRYCTGYRRNVRYYRPVPNDSRFVRYYYAIVAFTVSSTFPMRSTVTYVHIVLVRDVLVCTFLYHECTYVVLRRLIQYVRTCDAFLSQPECSNAPAQCSITKLQQHAASQITTTPPTANTKPIVAAVNNHRNQQHRSTLATATRKDYQ
jgi:hypothetical protein